MDISSFVTWFIDTIINIFTKLFSILDSITFMGISLLQYSITILILSAVINLLITIPDTNVDIPTRKEPYKPRHSSDNKMVGTHGRRVQSRSQYYN